MAKVTITGSAWDGNLEPIPAINEPELWFRPLATSTARGLLTDREIPADTFSADGAFSVELESLPGLLYTPILTWLKNPEDPKNRARGQAEWEPIHPASGGPISLLPGADEGFEAGVRRAIFRGDLPEGTDLNLFGGHENTGAWRIGSTGHTNGPGVDSSGILEVIRIPGTLSALAVLQRITVASSMWWREAIDYGTGQWGAWRKVATSDDVPTRGLLPDGADLNTYRLGQHAGTYSIASTGSYLNAPSIDYGGVFEVVSAPGNNFSAAQRITTQASMWWREAIDHGVGSWGSWKRVATFDDIIGGGGGGLSSTTIAYSEGAGGTVTHVHGDVDHLIENGVASITKMFTVWTARRHLTDAELDETATVQAGDMSDSPHLKVGDVVSFRDLCYTSMVNSDSTAPNVLARTIGAKIDPGSSTPRSVFLAAMEAEAARLGYVGATFPMAVSGARVSARHIVDLFRRFRADAQLRPMPAALTHTVTVVGGPNPRTYPVYHTIDPSGAVPIPEFRAGKTGTTSGRAHVVIEWRHPDGTDHITAILNTPEAAPNQRYLELRKVIDGSGPMTLEVLGYPAHFQEYVQEKISDVAQAPANAVVDARIDVRRGGTNGVASLDADKRVPVGQLPLDAVAVLVDDQVDAKRGAASGLASLDAEGKVPAGQVPMSEVADSAEIGARLEEVPATVLGPLQYPGGAFVPSIPRVVTNDDAEGIDGNIYGPGVYTTPSGHGLSQGSRAEPVTDARPVYWVQKFSSANRDTYSTEWDQAGYFGLEKLSGDAYAAALTGYARHDSSDGGDAIGVHGRARANKAESKSWGGWFYAESGDTDVVPVSIMGIEINLRNRNPDQGHGAATGYSTGLLVATQDNSEPVTTGISVARGTGAPNGFIHTGIRVRASSISPAGANSTSGVPDNEAFDIGGATASASAAGGVRLRGWHRYGISLVEASVTNNIAIALADGHRITVGGGTGVNRGLQFSSSESYANFQDMFIRINGVQVVRSQRTGWAAATGTATRTAFATSTVTLPELAQRVKALIDDLTSHGLIGA